MSISDNLLHIYQKLDLILYHLFSKISTTFFLPDLGSQRQLPHHPFLPNIAVSFTLFHFSFLAPSPFSSFISLFNSGLRVAFFKIAHAMYCLRHFLPLFLDYRDSSLISSLFLSSSASPYFVLLLAVSLVLLHRPWYFPQSMCKS